MLLFSVFLSKSQLYITFSFAVYVYALQIGVFFLLYQHIDNRLNILRVEIVYFLVYCYFISVLSIMVLGFVDILTPLKKLHETFLNLYVLFALIVSVRVPYAETLIEFLVSASSPALTRRSTFVEPQ